MSNKIAVSFKHGLLADLPATKTPGAIYITTDERALYMDVSAESRIRLGDFQSFASVEALEANANPNTTALYYVEDINCLAKWDGSQYVQINRDTGMTSVESTGDGNAVTSATYNAVTRKLTLSKGITFALPSDITTAIQGLRTEDAAVSGKYVSAVSQSDGVITVTREDLPDYTDVYDPKGAAAAVLGADDDTSASETVKGARLLANEKVASVGAAENKGIEIGGTATAPTVGIKLSAKDGNDLGFADGDGEDGGLYFKQAAAPVITVQEKETANTGYLKSYQVCVDGSPVAVDIDIPKDFLVRSCTLETVSAVNTPYSGAAVGDKYIDFVINTKNDALLTGQFDFHGISLMVQGSGQSEYDLAPYLTGKGISEVLINSILSTPLDGNSFSIRATCDGKEQTISINLADGQTWDDYTVGSIIEAVNDKLTIAQPISIVDRVISTGSEESSHLYLPVQDLVDVYEAGDGLELRNGNVFTVKLDAANANGLGVTASGLKLDAADGTHAGAMSAADHTKLTGISTGANKVEASATNGNIKIDNAETVVYTLPSDVARVGANTDTEDADTVYGAKAFATDADTALASFLKGDTTTDTKDSATIAGAKKYADNLVQESLSWGTF